MAGDFRRLRMGLRRERGLSSPDQKRNRSFAGLVATLSVATFCGVFFSNELAPALSHSRELMENSATAAQGFLDKSRYYPDCGHARAAGAAPMARGTPGYRRALDADGDGMACEPLPGT